jgi:hypothetical protein
MLIVQIPAHSLAQAFIQRHGRLPSKFPADFRRINGIWKSRRAGRSQTDELVICRRRSSSRDRRSPGQCSSAPAPPGVAADIMVSPTRLPSL